MSTSIQNATFYVSQMTGDDSFSGMCPTAAGAGEGPFQTLQRAIAAVAEYRKAGIERPLFISLVDDYCLREPICLRGIGLVTVESYGTRKRIIGGVRIEGWRESEFNGHRCLCADVPQDVKANFTDLYVNGERARVTRFPRDGKLRIVDGENVLRGPHISSEHLSFSSRWFLVDPKDLAELDKIEDASIHYDHFWIDEHSPIESYDRESGKLVMRYNSRFCVSVSYDENPNAAPYYYLTNLPNCFEECGQWYLDRAARKVYYIPENEATLPDEIEAYAPVAERLFVIEGEDVRLKNLELCYTKGDYASTKRYDRHLSNCMVTSEAFASDIQSVCCAHGAIAFKGAKRCGIFDCTLHGLGVHAIEILAGCERIHIENNHIYDICAGGIRMEGENVPNGVVSDCMIRGNHIHACGKRYLAGCGILVMHASHCEISENEIHDLEYSGISVGWVWGYGESATYGCIIKKNHIYDIGKGNLSDLGGIYLLGKQQGTMVSENRIHDVSCYAYGAWGIYLDEGSSFVTVENNVVYRTGCECFHLHYGSHNTVRNNVFFGGKNSCIRISRHEEHDQILFERNLLITDGAPVYGTKCKTENLRSGRNLLWDIQKGTPILWSNTDGEGYDLDTWQSKIGCDFDSVVAEPAFVNASEFDFRLSSDSATSAIGFVPISDEVARN